MVTQIDDKFDFSPVPPNEPEINFKDGRRAGRSLSPRADEVIRSLANAYENRRARQVVEWERLARQNTASAA